MEPRFFERGNLMSLAQAREQAGVLQWSRASLSAEMRDGKGRGYSAQALQWSRASLSAEIWPTNRRSRRPSARFNGAALL